MLCVGCGDCWLAGLGEVVDLIVDRDWCQCIRHILAVVKVVDEFSPFSFAGLAGILELIGLMS